MILYDGTDDDARVVGLSYYIRHDGDAEPTQGFTGNNDHFHRHDGLCVDATGVIGDSTTTDEECAAIGGHKAKGGNGWMNHAWVVPGCESPWGVFSGASPVLDGDLGADHGESGAACAGSGTRDRYDLTPGEVENVPTTSGGELQLIAAKGAGHTSWPPGTIAQIRLGCAGWRSRARIRQVGPVGISWETTTCAASILGEFRAPPCPASSSRRSRSSRSRSH